MVQWNDQDVWTSGTRLKNRPYVVEEQLGEGGFGLTHRARHLSLDLQVVLKTPNRKPRSDPKYAKFIARFQKEGQLLARFSQYPHLSIVRVSDLFEEDGYPCLVMDLVPGKDLRTTVLETGPLSPLQAISYFRQIGDALRRVHDAGLVHRDAHAGNIMLPDPARAVLIDFGIAGDIIPSTSDSMVAFNPGFAPYEQIMGRSRSPSVDIYTISASLYLAITGEMPPASLARKVDGQELTAPRALNPRIPSDLDRVVLRGLEIEPEDRPANMGEWLELFPKEARTTRKRAWLDMELEVLLRGQKWREADLETSRLLLRRAGLPDTGYFEQEQITNLNWADLRAIDLLWRTYSDGRFGFGVQKRIWFECLNDWRHFATRVGWLRDGKSVRYSGCSFSLEAPEGHLPIWGAGRGVRTFWGGKLRGIKTFLYRVHAGGL